MGSRIEQLVQQIRHLEEELRHELNQRSQVIGFTIRGKRVEFERSIKQTHRRLKFGFWRWLFGVRTINIITLPIIYSMIIPLVLRCTGQFLPVHLFSGLPHQAGQAPGLHRV